MTQFQLDAQCGRVAAPLACEADDEGRWNTCCSESPKKTPSISTSSGNSSWCSCSGASGGTTQASIDSQCNDPLSRSPRCMDDMAPACCNESPKKSTSATRGGDGSWSCSCVGSAPSVTPEPVVLDPTCPATTNTATTTMTEAATTVPGGTASGAYHPFACVGKFSPLALLVSALC